MSFSQPKLALAADLTDGRTRIVVHDWIKIESSFAILSVGPPLVLVWVTALLSDTHALLIRLSFNYFSESSPLLRSSRR